MQQNGEKCCTLEVSDSFLFTSPSVFRVLSGGPEFVVESDCNRNIDLLNLQEESLWLTNLNSYNAPSAC